MHELVRAPVCVQFAFAGTYTPLLLSAPRAFSQAFTQTSPRSERARERERRVLVSLTRLEVAQRLRVSVCLYYPATPSKSLSRALSCKIVKSTSVKSAARKRSRQRNIPPPCPSIFPLPSRVPLSRVGREPREGERSVTSPVWPSTRST